MAGILKLSTVRVRVRVNPNPNYSAGDGLIVAKFGNSIQNSMQVWSKLQS